MNVLLVVGTMLACSVASKSESHKFYTLVQDQRCRKRAVKGISAISLLLDQCNQQCPRAPLHPSAVSVLGWSSIGGVTRQHVGQ